MGLFKSEHIHISVIKAEINVALKSANEQFLAAEAIRKNAYRKPGKAHISDLDARQSDAVLLKAKEALADKLDKIAKDIRSGKL